MRGDSNDEGVFYCIAAVACIFVMVGLLGIILENLILILIPIISFALLSLLALALYKRWPIPFLKR